MKCISVRLIKLLVSIAVLHFAIKFALRAFMPSPNISVTESKITKHTLHIKQSIHYTSSETKYFTKAKLFPNVNYSNNAQNVASHEPKVLGGKKNRGGQSNLALVQFIFGNSFKDLDKDITTPLKFSDHYDETVLVPVNKKSSSYERHQPVFNLTENEEKNPQNVGGILQDDIEIYGTFKNDLKYVVFSTTTDSRDSMSFIFYLPLTVLAWKRVQFDSVVIIVGSSITWNSDPLLSFVLEQLKTLKAVLIFLESRSHMSTMLSQVARIYAGNILYTQNNSTGDAYLLTTDADIWPISGEEYLLSNKKKILSLNAECCAPFKHRGRVYRMLPMSNVGMKIKTWHLLTSRFSMSPSSVDEILTQVVREFGSIALRPTRKGDNVGWFLDQMLISVFIALWDDHHPTDVKYTSRNTFLDRIDRNSWILSQNIDDKIDAHLPNHGYRPDVWSKIVPLVDLLYGRHSKEFRFCDFYLKEFTRRIQENGIP